MKAYLKFTCGVLVALAACSHAAQTAAQSSVPVRPDVQFMKDMIEHHSQAIEMSELVPSRSTNENLKSIADRIGVAQGDEIKRMSVWLMAHGEPVPETHTHEGAGGHEMPANMLMPHTHGAMPGMLGPEDFDRLRAASGIAFDRLFIQLMIRHHEGALQMVKQILGAQGGVQDADLFQIANNIDADQRAEIARMNVLLASLK